MRRLVAITVLAFVVLVAGGAAADTFALTVVSQTNSTITFSYPQQPGFGYLYSTNGTVVSRTNDPSRTQVKFSKASTYEVAAIVKGTTGSYPGSTPPPPKPACSDSLDNDGDGKIDYPADTGCSSLTDTDETNPAPAAACADGVDNDGDGLVDLADPGCSNSSDNDETNTVTPPPTTGFPDASNTGVPAGTSLTAYTGPSNITTNNTVIDGKTIGCIQINATGVIIRNSKISCGGGYAVYIDDAANWARSSNGTVALVTVEDSEIDCKGTSGTAVGEADFVVRRVEITGCENGFDMNQNGLIEDSFIHNLYAGGSAHTDGLQSSGRWNGSTYLAGMGNVTIRHNTIFGQGAPNDSLFGTSAIISGRGGDTNVLIDSNLLAGGSYTLYCEQGAKGTNYVVTNNRFSTRFKATVGYYGPVTDCQDETASGNRYYETGGTVPGIG